MANNNLGPGGQIPRIGMPVVPAADAQQQQPPEQQQQQQRHQQHQQLSAAAAAAAVGAAQQAAVEAIRRQEASTRAAAAAAAVAANENVMLGSLSHHHHHHQNWFASQAAAIAMHHQQQQQQQQTAQATAANAQAYAHAQAFAVAAAAAAAEASAHTKPSVSNQPLGDRDPEGIGVMGVIPIGFFRDPEGNAWAASLQHPSHASNRRPPLAAADESPLAAAMSQAALRFAAQQHMADHQQQQQQQQQLKQNSGRKQPSEVIDLQSDEDEEDREEEEPTKRPGFATKPNLMQGALKVPPPLNPALPMQHNSKEQQTKAHLQEQRNATSDRRPGASMPSPRMAAALRDGSITQILQAPTESHFHSPSKKPPFSQAFVTKRPAPSLLAPVDPATFRQHHLQQAQLRTVEDPPQAKRRKSDTGSTNGGANANANAAHLNVNRIQPTTPEAPTPEVMNERHTHALRQVILSDKTSNLALHYGPCVHKWLGAGLTEEETETAVKEFVDSILMAATGYTHETVPPSLPFPPSEINLDMRQLEELAQEFVAEKNSAIGEAVRCAFTEMKASHDDAVVNRKHYYDEAKRLEKEMGSLKTKHRRELNDIRVQNDKKVESLNQRIKELEEQLQSVKVETGTSTVAQTKSLETMMKASILTLRMIRRAERNKEQ